MTMVSFDVTYVCSTATSRHASIDESDEPVQPGPWSRRPPPLPADAPDGPTPTPPAATGTGVQVEVNSVPVGARSVRPLGWPAPVGDRKDSLGCGVTRKRLVDTC